ncbi:glycosyl transferase family 2 [Catenulispora acidiphila DSM 44928]|uniref:Glycosyl transferase family 2 n=1 Tax=Catenulispora acidiphila (strain DSM 44928 / JCM 14897 / NBRC 102108 / NRRL B-24433 / ID139908) TaxID=479433 RepID=C7PYL1_CATAD|nr:glycosyl transferase family 2 [Catenulispora acidiphila DSM 44928]
MRYWAIVVSVIIPAHNEASVVGRLLSRLLADAAPGEFEVWVVANGCTDDTAEIAGAFADVKVLIAPEANKHAAMRLADEHAEGFPRLYVDADVEFGARDVRALAAAFDDPGVLAAGPSRALPPERRPWTVRWFYDVWDQLPVVRAGLFGRGVVGVSREGWERLRALPPLLGDDLAASLLFEPAQRRVVSESTVIVHPPRTAGALLRIRTRALVSTLQAADDSELSSASDSARTSLSDLRAIALASPVRATPKVAWFLVLTVATKIRARRAVRAKDFRTWHRDDTSR